MLEGRKCEIRQFLTVLKMLIFRLDGSLLQEFCVFASASRNYYSSAAPAIDKRCKAFPVNI
jgi:hypothetical protein